MSLRPSEPLRPGGAATVGFFKGEVVVRAPKGYCVDSNSVQRRGSSRFVLLTSCAHLRQNAPHEVPASVITVSVLPRVAGAEQPSSREMAEAAGGGVLSAEDGDGIALIHLANGGSGVINGGADAHWRAAMVINEHLIGLAAYSRPGGVATDAGGRDVLIDLTEEMRDASPVRLPCGAPESVQVEALTPAASGASEPRTPVPAGGLRSLLSGLFQNPG
ncbi:hypothetical protein DD563_07885 [Pelagicola sp. LXJ1103]|nr:hypothetical protein DD563_07885 [Pelagicola sp. LXJ1103]